MGSGSNIYLCYKFFNLKIHVLFENVKIVDLSSLLSIISRRIGYILTYVV